MYEQIAAAFPDDELFQYIYKVNPRSLTLEYWTDHFELRYLKTCVSKGNDVIFDFGCGMGCMTALLRREGYNIFGYDVSPGLTAVAQLNDPGGTYYFTFPERTDYTRVWMSHVLEHVPFEEWESIFKSFKEGVSILISVPLGYAYDDGSGHHINFWEDVEQLRIAVSPYASVLSASEDIEHSVLRVQCQIRSSSRHGRLTKETTSLDSSGDMSGLTSSL